VSRLSVEVGHDRCVRVPAEHAWWLLPIVQLGAIPIMIIWDEPIKSILKPFVHPLINVWSPLFVYIAISVGL
jgi:hypothetical protein